MSENKGKVKRSTVKGRDFWGPPLWTSIHILAATLRPENAEAFKSFLESLTVLLPCEKCKVNLKAKLIAYPPDPYLTNNHDAFFYTYFIHDLVNEHVSDYHPKESPDFDEVKNFYFNGLAQECKDCQV